MSSLWLEIYFLLKLNLQLAIFRFHDEGTIYLSAFESFLYWTDKRNVIIDGKLGLYCYYYF